MKNLSLTLFVMLLIQSCIGVRQDDSIDLGNNYRFIQDTPQTIIYHSGDKYKGTGEEVISNTLNFHASGNNEGFFFGASPNIDVKLGARFTKKSDNIFNVSGSIIGGRFPANESYLVDDLGHKVFLGVAGVDINIGAISPTFGPGVLFERDNKIMYTFSFNIKFQEIDGNTVFQSVILNDGTEYNLDEWNKIFKSLDPKSIKTGTDVRDNEIRTNTDKDDGEG